ncbi:MAG: aspartate carbamoyltransferase catalytic subunit [Clostridiales bacterium]|nr:aspartate carbamoyltransferase catalytic subunit [Clostridiales bacterium]
MLSKKDLLGLEGVPKEEINAILDTAIQMKKILMSGSKKTPHLQGKSVILVFFENSTRTRVSFDLASKYLSAASSAISASASSVSKGETLLDTARTLDRMQADVIVMRHPMSGAPHFMAKNVNASVINAGDGMHEHPTQALLDMFTIREAKGDLQGMKIAIVGDIMHSRVARSNAYGMQTMGAEVILAGPSTMIPPGIEEMGIKTTTNVDEALTNADVVMGLRIQKERQSAGLFPSVREYYKYFGIDQRRIELAKEDAIIMHPGPVNRGVEMSSMMIDSDMSLIDEQVTNGLAIRMALLFMLTRSER